MSFIISTRTLSLRTTCGLANLKAFTTFATVQDTEKTRDDKPGYFTVLHSNYKKEYARIYRCKGERDEAAVNNKFLI